jgi:hypothetical protein
MKIIIIIIIITLDLGQLFQNRGVSLGKRKLGWASESPYYLGGKKK